MQRDDYARLGLNFLAYTVFHKKRGSELMSIT